MDKIININSFYQGNEHDDTNEYRIKSAKIRAYSSDSVTVTASENLEINLIGYADETTIDKIFDYYWYSTPKNFNFFDKPNLKFWLVGLRHKDGTKISPAENISVTITVENLWYIAENGDLINGSPEIPEKAMKKPYPLSLWRINLKNSDLPHHKLFPNEISGAFTNAVNLKKIHIPETVRKIGKYSFFNTGLEKVKISQECEFFDTSFPENCEIEFY